MAGLQCLRSLYSAEAISPARIATTLLPSFVLNINNLFMCSLKVKYENVWVIRIRHLFYQSPITFRPT